MLTQDAAFTYVQKMIENRLLRAVSLKQTSSGRHDLMILGSMNATAHSQIVDLTNFVAIAIGEGDRLKEKNNQFVIQVNPGYDPTIWVNAKWKEVCEFRAVLACYDDKRRRACHSVRSRQR